ncbi:MAG: prolyl oligopeptidase family serine peptidase [Spirochaetes bacterium]|nr:prolyl oligopeptidase family serine peptidase [Spirochaetota bacterium]
MYKYLFATIVIITLFTECRKSIEIKPPKVILHSTAIKPSGSYTFPFEGRDRKFTIHLPSGREMQKNLPLVVALHGGPGNAKNLEENTRLSEKADSAGFIVVYPDGTSYQNPWFLNWNSGGCCGYAWENKVNDVGFLRALIKKLIREYAIDKRRVYAMGFSKGGMMSHHLACEASDVFTGIADIAGALNQDSCKPKRGLDVFIVHGRADRNVRFGGELPKKLLPLPDSEDRPVAYAVAIWSRNNRCALLNTMTQADVVMQNFICERGSLRVADLENDGHTWPGAARDLLGSDMSAAAININDAVWDFWRAAYRQRLIRARKK